jgi:hypothetical protein
VRTQLLIATDDARKVDSVQSMLRYALDGNVILHGPFVICRMVTFIDSPGTTVAAAIILLVPMHTLQLRFMVTHPTQNAEILVLCVLLYLLLMYNRCNDSRCYRAITD